MTQRPPHVLVVSFGYAPLAHVSGTRATHMARELTLLGWDVSVLTVDWASPLPPEIRSIDATLERALAEPSPRRIALDGRLADPAFDPEIVPPTSSMKPPRTRFRRLQTFRSMLGWGAMGMWARHAYGAARRLHARRPIDVVWPIHGDDSCHEIARQLQKRAGIPWVADFKDPWSNLYSQAGVGVARFVHARRLRSAVALTETCAAQGEADQREFSLPFHTVYSGYDAELMASVRPERSGAGFCIVYTGAIGLPHDLRLLPGLFAELRKRGLTKDALELHQYARPSGQLRRQLEAVGCAEIVRDHDRVPRERAFALMRGADALLIFPATNARGRSIGLKEIESAASGTPMLVLGQPLAELDPVFRACPNVQIALDAVEGADFLEQEVRELRERGSSSRRAAVNHPALRDFTWVTQAEKLSAVLGSAAGR